MKRLILIAAALAACAMIAADPATQPTTSPSTKPSKQVSWQAVVRSLPKELRPPKGQQWAYGEKFAAAKWVAEKLEGSRVKIKTTNFFWNGGDAYQATYISDTYRAHGINWTLAGQLNFRSSEKSKAARLRNDDSISIGGTVDKAQGSGSNAGTIDIGAPLIEAEVN